MKFEVIKQAKLTQEDIAHFLKVSRITVNNWINGHGGIHEARKTRVMRLLDAISSALADGKLPLQGVPKEERRARAGKVLVQYLRANKE